MKEKLQKNKRVVYVISLNVLVEHLINFTICLGKMVGYIMFFRESM